MMMNAQGLQQKVTSPRKNEINGTVFEDINYFALNVVDRSFVLTWMHMIIAFHLGDKSIFYHHLALIMIESKDNE